MMTATLRMMPCKNEYIFFFSCADLFSVLIVLKSCPPFEVIMFMMVFQKQLGWVVQNPD